MQEKYCITEADLIGFLRHMKKEEIDGKVKIKRYYIPCNLKQSFEDYNLQIFTGKTEIIFEDTPYLYCENDRKGDKT